MLARTLFTRLSVCCSPIIQQYARVIPFTCKTTSMVRQLSCSVCLFQEESSKRKDYKTTSDPKMEGYRGYIPRQIDAEHSIKYMESEAYSDVYKDEPVWKPYRGNSERGFYPRVRRTCIRNGNIATASPCPICRDDYLVLDYRNVKLLKQFVSNITGKPLNVRRTGLCRTQHRKLELEVTRAQDYGFLQKTFPLRWYNYRYYYGLLKKKRVSREPAQRASTEPAQRASTEPAQRASTEPAQRASTEPAQRASTEPAQRASTEAAQRASTEPVQRASTEPAQRASTEPAQRESTEAAQKASQNQNEQPSGQS